VVVSPSGNLSNSWLRFAKVVTALVTGTLSVVVARWAPLEALTAESDYDAKCAGLVGQWPEATSLQERRPSTEDYGGS
jgi:hypothetical protein